MPGTPIKPRGDPDAAAATGSEQPSETDLLEAWLQRHLQEAYGVVDREIPKDLLRLIEHQRQE